jgi:type IV fimbrial biogenesis protein FimT
VLVTGTAGAGCRRSVLAAQAHGFTLIELMVTVSLIAIVSAIAAPNFRSLIGTMNAKSAAFDLIGDLTAARSEAIKRNQSTTVAPLEGDWSKGWEVRRADDVALRAHPALTSSLAVSGAPSAGVTFRPNGRLSDDTVTGNLTWTISSSISGVTARCVVITTTGSARSRPGVCS